MVKVLVAVTILSLALLAYLNVTLASRAAVEKGSAFTIAAQVAGDKIAECQAKGYGGLADGPTTYSVSGLRQGQMMVVIGPLDGNPSNTDIKQVDVTVTWAAAGGQMPQTAGSVKHSILISNRK